MGCARGLKRNGSACVNLAPMSYANDDDDESVIFDGTDQPVVSNAIFPELPQWAMQAFAEGAGIVERSDSLTQELEDTVGDGLVELFQFATGVGVELNRPTQYFKPCSRIISSSGMVLVRPASIASIRFSAR